MHVVLEVMWSGRPWDTVVNTRSKGNLLDFPGGAKRESSVYSALIFRRGKLQLEWFISTTIMAKKWSYASDPAPVFWAAWSYPWTFFEVHLKTFFKFISFLFYAYERIAYLCVSSPMSYNARGGQKRVLDALELELWMVLSCHVGARNHTWVPWKSSQCS